MRPRIAVLLVVALVATMLVAPAAADPDSSRLQQLQRELRDLESEAAQERSQLGALDAEQESLVSERETAERRLSQIEAELSLAVDVYNGAVEALEQVQAERAATAEELAALQSEIDTLQGNVADHVRRLHKLGPSLEFSAITGASDPADIGFRSTSLRHIITLDQAGIERLSAATDRAAALASRLVEQEADASGLTEVVEAELRAVEDTYDGYAEEMAGLEATLARVEASLAAQRDVVTDTDQELRAVRQAVEDEQSRLEAQRRAERATAERAAAERAAAARTAPEPSGSGSSGSSSGSSSNSTRTSSPAPTPAPAPAPAPSTRRSAGTAVATALAQVGKPYRWGANGPGSYDCSGLTSYAWRSAGVSIPRTSRGQFSGLTRVSRAQLQPGDLLFQYSPVSHVAMYIGNNTVVEASRPGVPVRVSSVSGRSWVGYARP